MRYLFLFPLLVLFSSSFNSSRPSVPQPMEFPMGGSKEWNVSLKDTAGNMVSLSDFKGKFVFVDLWASWCKPCLVEIEPTAELQEKLKDKEIEWVFISFDRDEKSWKQAIKKHKMKGIHLYGTPKSTQMKKDFNIHSIPYYVWLNKNGDVVMEDAPRPSDGIEKKLKHYLSY